MKKLYYSILFILTFSAINAQVNLVSNPGFEIAAPCPDYPGQTNYATGWNNVNLIYNNPSVGTPDFFHACGSATLGYNCVPPNTFAGVCTPHGGLGMMGLVIYNTPYPNYREYLGTMLTAPMLTGNTYSVSFWITNGSTPYSPYTIKNIGINFSSSPLTQSGWSLINLNPTLEITSQVGSTAWQQYSFTVTPSANWQYMTFGAFRSDAMNNPVSTYSVAGGPASVYARYFVDDFSVTLLSAQGINEAQSVYSDIKIYPNPAANKLSFSSTTAIESVSVTDMLGRQTISETKLDETNSLDLSSLENGIYFVHLHKEGKVIATRKFVKEN